MRYPHLNLLYFFFFFLGLTHSTKSGHFFILPLEKIQTNYTLDMMKRATIKDKLINKIIMIIYYKQTPPNSLLKLEEEPSQTQ